MNHQFGFGINEEEIKDSVRYACAVEVQLESMVLKWPKMYPVGNYFDPYEITEQNKKFHTYDAEKLEESKREPLESFQKHLITAPNFASKYQLKFVPEDYATQCIRWKNGYIGIHVWGTKFANEEKSVWNSYEDSKNGLLCRITNWKNV